MIKLIIFDVDGTLYDLNDVVLSNYKTQVDFLCYYKKWSDEQAISFLNKNHVYPLIQEDSMSATELFVKVGFDKECWTKYREERYPIDSINICNAVSKTTLNEFKSIAECVLLSSNSFVTINRILERLGIACDLFNCIVCSDRFSENVVFTKRAAMQLLSEKYDVPFPEILSIGDRFKTDIQPMIELGGQGILIKKPLSLIQVIKDIKCNALTTCVDYTYYE